MKTLLGLLGRKWEMEKRCLVRAGVDPGTKRVPPPLVPVQRRTKALEVSVGSLRAVLSLLAK